MFDTDITSEQNTENTESLNTEAGEQPESKEVVDLDSMERFRFDGRELTPKELKNMVLMQSDYTKKTQEISQERKYYENLRADLDYVSKNPALAAKFKEVYPEKYHAYLNYVTKQQEQPSNQVVKQAAQQAQSNPLEDRINKIESYFHERNVAAIQSEIDAKFQTLSKKYPFADEEAVLARAQSLIDQGQDINDKTWDQLWKVVSDKNQKIAEQFYSQKVNQQKTMNSKGRDMGAGGTIPGQAPRNPKTIKEASKFALQELENMA